MISKFTRRQWMALFIIGLADLCYGICISLLAPFFPKEAEQKGASPTEYGLIVGIFELVVFATAPVFGKYIDFIGAKRMFNWGVITTGATAGLFGALILFDNRYVFVGLAFIIRIIGGVGSGAFITASFALIAREFPENVATTFATLETCFGSGLIIGPMVGGILYSLDGFYLPFVTIAAVLFITAILTNFILPERGERDADFPQTASLLNLIKIPGVIVCILEICATNCSLGFLTATLEPHLRQFNLGPIATGSVFIVNGGVYALTAPIMGWLIDKYLDPKVVALFGSVAIAISFCLIGPISFIPIDTTLEIVIVGLLIHGLGLSACLVSSFIDSLRTAIANGFADNIETYGLVSGLWSSIFALGAFIGPSLGGILIDAFDFRRAVIFIFAFATTMIFVITSFMLYEKYVKKPADYEPLIGDRKNVDYNPLVHGSDSYGATAYRR